MRAMSALIRDAGMSTRVCFALTALRIRVSMSAIGSVIVLDLFLPAALGDAGDVAFERELAETQAAQRELAHVGARAAAQAAAVAQPNLVFRRLQFLRTLCCRCHTSSSARLKARAPEREASAERSSSA